MYRHEKLHWMYYTRVFMNKLPIHVYKGACLFLSIFPLFLFQMRVCVLNNGLTCCASYLNIGALLFLFGIYTGTFL